MVNRDDCDADSLLDNLWVNPLEAYLGYPCLLAMIAWFRDRKLLNQSGEPTLSVIIAAFNEQKHIGQKLANTLAMDYPQEKLEVIVASDCSTR